MNLLLFLSREVRWLEISEGVGIEEISFCGWWRIVRNDLEVVRCLMSSRGVFSWGGGGVVICLNREEGMRRLDCVYMEE